MNTDWQPIDTAPRDGTPVDLWHKGGFRITDTWWDESDGWTCLQDPDDFPRVPEWCPLPDHEAHKQPEAVTP